MYKFLTKNTTSPDIGKKLKGLWITNIEMYPRYHGCSVYTANLSKELSNYTNLDLVYFKEDSVYEANPRLYLGHFKNIFHISKELNIDEPILINGLNNYTNIINKNLVNWVKLNLTEQNYDFVICDYVYMAKIFDFIPDHIVKIINTHDVYGDRHIGLKWNDVLKKQAFCITSKDEKNLLSRSNILISVNDDESNLFRKKITNVKKKIEVLSVRYKPEKISFKPKSLGDNLIIGFIGSTNPINRNGLNTFLVELDKLDTKNITLVIAGLISNSVKNNYKWVKCIGVLPDDDIKEFYKSIDVVINPMPKNTTGLKIKTVDSLINNMPIIGTDDAFTGIKTNSNWHKAESISFLAQMVVDISKNLNSVNSIKSESLKTKDNFLNDCKNDVKNLHKQIQNKYLDLKKLKNRKNNDPLVSNYANEMVLLDHYYSEKYINLYKKFINQNENNLELIERVDTLQKALKPNYMGYISVLESSGLYRDNWCENEMYFKFIAAKKISLIKLYLLNYFNQDTFLKIKINDAEHKFNINKKNHLFKIPCFLEISSANIFSVSASFAFNPPDDSRKLSYILEKIILE